MIMLHSKIFLTVKYVYNNKEFIIYNATSIWTLTYNHNNELMPHNTFFMDLIYNYYIDFLSKSNTYNYVHNLKSPAFDWPEGLKCTSRKRVHSR